MQARSEYEIWRILLYNSHAHCTLTCHLAILLIECATKIAVSQICL